VSQGPPYGWTASGFVPKPLTAIIADLQQQIWSTIDDTLDLSPQSVDGQLLLVVANELAAMWPMIETAADQYDRSETVGAGLDNIGDILGVPRESESFTQVYCVCTLATVNAPYAAGALTASIAGFPSLTFTNVAAVTLAEIAAAGGTPTVLFQSTTIGATAAPAVGTLTAISTPVTGWSAVTNPAPGYSQLGSNEELDEAYMARQGEEVAAGGSCTPAATAAQLVQLGAAQSPPVTLTVIVIENASPYQATVAGVSLAPHTYMVVIDDGGVGYSSSNPLGSCTVTNGSTAITFASNQTLAAGTPLSFAGQPAVIYSLAAPIAAATAGVLTQTFSGNTATLPAAVPGAGWLPNAAGQSIGATIYANKPTGISSVGSTALTVADPILGNEIVYFSEPTPFPLFISATIVPRPASNIPFPTLVASVQAALIAAAVAPTLASSYPPVGQLAPGSTVVGSQLEAVIMSVPGVFDVTSLFFGFSPGPGATTPIQLPATQVATILESNIANLIFVQGPGP